MAKFELRVGNGLSKAQREGIRFLRNLINLLSSLMDPGLIIELTE